MFTLYLGVDLDLAQMGFDGALVQYYPTIRKNPWEEMDGEGFDIEKERMAIRMDSIKNPMLAPPLTPPWSLFSLTEELLALPSSHSFIFLPCV